MAEYYLALRELPLAQYLLVCSSSVLSQLKRDQQVGEGEDSEKANELIQEAEASLNLAWATLCSACLCVTIFGRLVTAIDGSVLHDFQC